MKMRPCKKGEKECCANCCYLGIRRDTRGVAFAGCKKGNHKISLAYTNICDEWEKFV